LLAGVRIYIKEKEEFWKKFGKIEAFSFPFEMISYELLIDVNNIVLVFWAELINFLRFLKTLWLMICIFKIGFN